MTSEILMLIIIVTAIYLVIDEFYGKKKLTYMTYLMMGYTPADAKANTAKVAGTK